MTTAMHHDLVSPRIDERLRRGQLTEEQVDDFRDFLDRVDRDLLHHRIITDNAYTRWFRDGAGDGCRAGPLRPPVFGVLESVPGRGLAAGDQRPDAAAGAVGQGNPHERAGGDLPADAAARRRVRAADRRGIEGPGGRPRPGEHRGDGRRRAVPVPRRPLRMAARRRRDARAGLRRPGQAPARTSLRPSILRRASAALSAARTTRSPKGPASPSRTGPPPASGKSWKTACCRSRRPGCPRSRWPSSPGTTASRPSTPATPWKSSKTSSSPPGSTRRGSSRARTKSSTPSPCSGTVWKTTGFRACVD